MSNILKQVIKLQDMVLSSTVDFNNFERKLDNLARALDGVVNYINEREHLHVHNMRLITEALAKNGITVQLVVPTVITPENTEVTTDAKTDATPTPDAVTEEASCTNG